jgi:isopenicillin-N epimerase
MPFGNRGDWLLRDGVTYLNHGSFGARRKEVALEQEALRRRLEDEPITFLEREGPQRHERAMAAVAAFIGADPAGLAFVTNATTAIGCVARSFDLAPEAEIVTTNEVYNGIRRLLEKVAAHAGGAYREITIPVPCTTPDAIAEAVIEGLRDETRLLVVDHVSSCTGIVFPVAKIIAACRERGIPVLIDGAHAPGMLNLNIADLQPDWYAANLHKWVCAPIGAGVLWTAPQWRDTTRPMSASHPVNEDYSKAFQWQGTMDVTPWLCVERAIEVGAKTGWEAIRSHNHALVTWMHQHLVDAWGAEPLSPLDGSMLGSMAAVRLPDDVAHRFPDTALRETLYADHAIEAPSYDWRGGVLLRLSAQAYSRAEDLFFLLDTLGRLRGNAPKKV